jgi:hypothetical protein
MSASNEVSGVEAASICHKTGHRRFSSVSPGHASRREKPKSPGSGVRADAVDLFGVRSLRVVPGSAGAISFDAD